MVWISPELNQSPLWNQSFKHPSNWTNPLIWSTCSREAAVFETVVHLKTSKLLSNGEREVKKKIDRREKLDFYSSVFIAPKKDWITRAIHKVLQQKRSEKMQSESTPEVKMKSVKAFRSESSKKQSKLSFTRHSNQVRRCRSAVKRTAVFDAFKDLCF